MSEWATPAWKANPTTRLVPSPASRAWAGFIDGVLLVVVVFVLGAAAWVVSRLFWDPAEVGDGIGLDTSGWTTSPTVPTWFSWLFRGALLVCLVVMSGAAGPVGRRRSFGIAMAELRLVGAPVDRGALAEHGQDPARVEPPRWRIAARWVVPAVLFAVLVPFVTPLGAVLVLVLGWLPALVGPHRSVYDLVSGTAVVDGVGLAALADEEPGTRPATTS